MSTSKLFALFGLGLAIVGAASPALAGPYSNTKYRVSVTNDGRQVIARGAFSETYNAGDSSYLYCEKGLSGMLCAAYDRTTGISISCRVTRGTSVNTPSCNNSSAAACEGVISLGNVGAPTWDIAILNSIASATQHIVANAFFSGLNDDSYIEFSVPYGTTECSGLRTLKGFYISPKVQ